MSNIFQSICPDSALLRVTAVLCLASFTLAVAPAWAQPKHNIEGTPLDTLMNTHLRADVPEAKGFVTESRPDEKSLDYTPLTGPIPVRPKPRDPAGVKALQAELEGAGAKNLAKAKGLISVKPATTGKAKRTKAGKE